MKFLISLHIFLILNWTDCTRVTADISTSHRRNSNADLTSSGSRKVDFDPVVSGSNAELDELEKKHQRARVGSPFRQKTEYDDILTAEELDELDATGCPARFLGRCDCKTVVEDQKMNFMHGKQKFVVNCTNTGFTSANMLPFLPNFADELIFTGNKITNLPANLFGKDKDYPNLKKIDLTDNKIETIDGKAFHHVGEVEKLVLNHNNLSNATLHPRLFSNFYKLKELYLTNAFNDDVWNLSDLYEMFVQSNLTQLVKIHMEQNELELINNPNLFCSLKSLTQIYLAQNKLPDINLNVSCVPNLQVLDLRQNQIKTINEESYVWSLLNQTNRRGEPIRVELLGNKLACDCNLQSFIHWLRNATLKNTDAVRDLENLKCAAGLPKTNIGINVKAVEYTECPPTLKVANYSGLASVVSWILIILVVVVSVVILYLNRSCMYRFMRVRPCLVTSGSSSGYSAYTSIDKNEEAEVAHV